MIAHDPPSGKAGGDDFAEALSRLRAYIASSAEAEEKPPLFIPFNQKPAPVSMRPPFRPAATPTCAGITPGFEFLVEDTQPATRAEQRRAIRRVRAAVKQNDSQAAALVIALANRVEALEREMRKGRAA